MMIARVPNYMECRFFYQTVSAQLFAEITHLSCISVLCSQEPNYSLPEIDDYSTIYPSAVFL